MSALVAEAIATRVEAAAQKVVQAGPDALLVSAAANVRYLTGYTGSNGLALIAATEHGGSSPGHSFITDFRYTTQAAEEVPDLFSRVIAEDKLLDALAARLGGAGGRLAFEAAHLTVREHQRLRELLGDAWQLVPVEGVVEGLRTVKDARELEHIRAAAALAEEAMRDLLEEGIVGRTEREVALELELRMRRLGAEGASFEPIVAAGAQAALPHARPRAERIPADVLVTIDWGARHEGYCSDCTRTLATGDGIPARAREVYELVRSAQEQALAATRAGLSGRALDAVARRVISEGGYGEQFGHGLGHGVGLEVHEGPRLARTAGDAPLRAGSVVTIEPGIYLPGELGVRIEDLVIVTEEGCEVLTPLAKELTVIA